MRVLVVKTSSLGDVIHALPAVTDAGQCIPGVEFDWVVEAPFAEIPSWHPLVKNVIPVALRRWRKNPIKTIGSQEWRDFRQQLRSHHYDKIIDAQGLIKSAFLTIQAKGERCGLDRQSVRESLASFVYQKKIKVSRDLPAVTRVRQLFAKVLGYSVPDSVADYGLDKSALLGAGNSKESKQPIIFFHGTTWDTKHWPENFWRKLAEQVSNAGHEVLLPWGNEAEKARAERMAFKIE